MAIKIHDLAPAPGSKKRPKRVGRGIAAGGGKTAGRGTKGQKARRQIRPGFEGGQTALYRRMPKLRGFVNPFRVEYAAVNLAAVQKAIDAGITDVNPDSLRAAGLAPKRGLIKILAEGELRGSATVRAHGFSAKAAEAITAAGGSVERLPLPFSVRPAAKGNALTNR